MYRFRRDWKPCKGNLASNWKRFRRVWTNYEVASRLVKQSKEERTATLLTCLGPDALEIVDMMGSVLLVKRSVRILMLYLKNYKRFASARRMKFTSVINLTSGTKSRASPLIRT